MARRRENTIRNRKNELKKQDFQRKKADKFTIPDVIIACEDSVSSPTYFKMIIQDLMNKRIITYDSFVIANYKHSNPSGVLKDLENHKCDNGKTYKNFDHKWIVIDRDSERVGGGGHTAEDFNNALRAAEKLKVNVAYSNDSFELWYLLHFNYRETAILRDILLTQIIEKLKAKNQSKFSKLDKDTIKQKEYTQLIFNEILELQETAIKNAETLLLSYEDSHNPEKDNPSTTVHKLVKILNSLGKKEEEEQIEE
ncbi:MAG: RloB family protein [Sulfuricurvum sp.]|jgi:hypothetical protein